MVACREPVLNGQQAGNSNKVSNQSSVAKGIALAKSDSRQRRRRRSGLKQLSYDYL